MEPTSLTLFLSPHFDDVPLSCGGIAARLAGMGAHCIGITVFAAPHDENFPLSPFSQNMHDQWESAAGMNMQAINAVGGARKKRQCARLGCITNGLSLWMRLTGAQRAATTSIWTTQLCFRHQQREEDASWFIR